MRSATAGEITVLQGRYSSQYLRVEIQDSLGAWVDYSDYVNLDRQDRAEITQTNDERIAGFTVQLARDAADGSLSPLINSDIDLGRGIRIYGARIAQNTTPVAGDYKLLLDGRIDRWDCAQDPMTLAGRDRSGILVDRWVETETEYGSEEGVEIETVMQSIITDHASGAFTLVVQAGSSILTTPFLISPAYVQERMNVWDALQALAELIGYVIEYRWNDSAAAFQLTLLEPDRDTTTVQWTFGPDDYYDVTKLDSSLDTVRNAWSGWYRDAVTETRTQVTVVEQDSIDRFGIRLWAEIEEADDSPIDTAAEMTAMLDAALADCAWPDADHEIETDLFWRVQLGDYYRHSANAVHYDANQDYAVSGLSHVFEGGKAVTRLLTRGKPAGSPTSWRRRGRRRLDPSADPVVFGTLDLDGDDLYLHWVATNTIERVRWLVKPDVAPNITEVRASTDVDVTGAVLVHTFDPDGDPVQQVWVGFLGETLADVEVGGLNTLPYTYTGGGENFPTVQLTYLGRTTDGMEKWLATATGPGTNATLYIRWYAKGSGPPAYTQVGPSADPVQYFFSFAHPADGDPNVVIEAYAVDDSDPPLTSKLLTKESDSDVFPSGDVDLTIGKDGEVRATPRSIDTDSLSYRFKAVVAAAGTDAFEDPSLVSDADVGVATWAGTGFGTQVQLSDILSDIDPVPDGQELYLSGWMFNTASTTAAAQDAAVKSKVIRRSVPNASATTPALVIETETEVMLEDEQIQAQEDAHIGSVASFTNDTWAALQAGANTALNFSRTETYLEVWLSRDSSGDADEWARIWRSIIAFPTTGVDSSAIATEDSYVKLHVVLAPQTTITGQKVVLTKAVVGSATTMAHTDWGGVDGSVKYSEAKNVSDLTNGSDQTFLLTAEGAQALTDAIAAQTPFVVAIQIESDADDAEPTVTSPTTELSARTRFASLNNGTAAYRPVLSVTANLPQARVILRHSDPAGVTKAIEYRTKVGPADWPETWSTLLDNDPDPVPTGVLISNPIDVSMLESPPSWVQARLIYTVGAEDLYSSPITSSAFDLGRLPNVVVSFAVDKDWNAIPLIRGDYDTRSTKTAVAVGAAPTRPTRSACRLRDALDGRAPTTDDVAFAYDDIPVALTPGQKVIAAVLGFTAAAGGGSEATDVVYAEASRPLEPGGSDPVIDSITVSAIDDGAGGVDVTVTWTCSNVVDATHDMQVSMEWPPTVDTAWYETETAPDGGGAGGNSVTHNFGGLGAGGGSEVPGNTRCKITLVLVDSTYDDAELDSKVAYTMGIAT